MHSDQYNKKWEIYLVCFKTSALNEVHTIQNTFFTAVCEHWTLRQHKYSIMHCSYDGDNNITKADRNQSKFDVSSLTLQFKCWILRYRA